MNIFLLTKALCGHDNLDAENAKKFRIYSKNSKKTEIFTGLTVRSDKIAA
jgi:hypothetical protein